MNWIAMILGVLMFAYMDAINLPFKQELILFVFTVSYAVLAAVWRKE